MRSWIARPLLTSTLAFLAYLALTILLTYPVAFQITTHIAGLPGNDSLEFVWSTWWFKRALLELHTNPARISVLNYPDGIYFPLLPAMAQPFVLALPLAALFSPVVAFNLVYLLSFPLCGLTAYWLCAELSGDRRAGFVGGLIWAFFPNKLGHALAGHLFQLVVFTLPLAALFLLQLLRRPSIRNAILCSVFFALAASVHPIHGAYFLLPLLTVVIAVEFWRPPSVAPGGRSHVGDRLSNLRLAIRNSQLWKPLGLAAALTLLLILPLFAPALVATAQGRLGFLAEKGAVGFSTDLLAFFLPAPANPIVARTPLATAADRVVLSEFENIAYIGLVPLLLAIVGVRWNRCAARPWLVLGGVAAVLSLGPLLIFNGGLVRVPVETETYPVLMPYALVARLPFFQWSRTPSRLNQTVMFSLAILAAMGMAGVLARIRRRRIGWALWGLACAVIPLEYLVQWPMPTAPIEIPPALAALAGDDSFKAVMNLPVSDNAVNLHSLFQQTYHRHPMIGGRVYRDIPGDGTTHDFLSRLLRAAPTDDIAPPPSEADRLAVLQRYGVGQIIYQPLGDPDGSAKAALDSLFGDPISTDDTLAIYSVPPAPCPLLPAPCSLPPAPCSLPPAPCPPCFSSATTGIPPKPGATRRAVGFTTGRRSTFTATTRVRDDFRSPPFRGATCGGSRCG